MSTRRASSENWLAFRAATNVTARSLFKSLRAIATATLAADAVAFACDNKALAAALKEAARSRNFEHSPVTFQTAPTVPSSGNRA